MLILEWNISKLNREVCHGAIDLQRFFLSVVILSILAVPGCGVTDFLGAYFNTYYNARKLFNEAETEILSTPLQTSTKAERAFLAPFDIQPQTKAKFTSVIEKCSKLLQYHPESKLVDDALLMIGKSYYYQNEHQSAERKFKELLGSYPESDLALETRLLLANTYYRDNNKAAAAAEARQLIEDAKAAKEDALAAKAAWTLGHIELENKNYKEAIALFEMTADLGETAQERSSAYRKVAALYSELGDYEKAALAYEHAEDASDEYIGEYRGRIGYARMLSKLGKHEESLNILEDLIKNSNYREFFGEIDLEIGNVYRDQKDYTAAEAQYRYVDTAYARTEFSANSYFQLGLLYETFYHSYDSARVAYEKGKGEAPQADITPQLTKRSELLTKYITFRNAIAVNDSIKEFILHPPDTTVTLPTADSSKHETAFHDSTTQDSTGLHHVAVMDSAKPKAPRVPPPPLDTVQARLAFNKSELATLFYTGLDIRDSARYWYERVLLDHPASVHAARALYTLTRIYQSDSTEAPGKIDSLYRQLVERFPESEFAAEARRQLGLPPPRTEVDPLRTSYAKGESYMKRGDVDSALNSFKRIVQRDTSSQLSAQSEYAIGWIYENLKLNADSSLAYYQRLVKRFPNSQYTMMVQPKLAEVAAESQRKNQPTSPDTTVAPPVLKDEEHQLPTVKTGSPGEKAAAADSLGKKEPTEGPMNKRTDEDNPKP